MKWSRTNYMVTFFIFILIEISNVRKIIHEEISEEKTSKVAKKHGF